MLVVGMTGCGKMYYLLRLLETEYKIYFENIILICPTFELNEPYQEWKYIKDEDFIVLECEQDEIEYNIKKVKKYAKETFVKGRNCLLILDDCASSNTVKNQARGLTDLGFSASHCGLSTIVLTQQLMSIAKAYRDNLSKVATFYNPSSKDRKIFFEEYLTVDDAEKKSIISTLKNNDYARLEVFLRRPYSHDVVVP